MDAGELGSRNMSVTWLEVPSGVEQTLHSDEQAEGDLVLVPPATDHAISNTGEGELACVSVQSPPVAVAELYGRQMAEVSAYDDDEE